MRTNNIIISIRFASHKSLFGLKKKLERHKGDKFAIETTYNADIES